MGSFFQVWMICLQFIGKKIWEKSFSSVPPSVIEEIRQNDAYVDSLLWRTTTKVWMLRHFGHVQRCNRMDCSPPGSSLHGILQTRILEWVPFPSPRHLPDPGIKLVSLVSPSLAGRFFTASTTWLDLEAKLSKIKGKHVYNILGSGFLGILGRKGNPDFWTPFFICRVDPS